MLAPVQLIVATSVAIIVVVAFVPTLVVVVVCAQFVMCLVAQIGTTLFVGVVGMLAMDATGLEVLVLTLGGTLPVVALVVAVTAIVAELVLLASAMMTMMTIVVIVLSSVQPVAPALVKDVVYLALILFFQLVAQLPLYSA
jgi:hypothetical protein